MLGNKCIRQILKIRVRDNGLPPDIFVYIGRKVRATKGAMFPNGKLRETAGTM